MVKYQKPGSKLNFADDPVTYLAIDGVSLTSECQMPTSYDKKNFASNRQVYPYG